MEDTRITEALKTVEDFSSEMLTLPEDDRIGIYRKLDKALLQLEGHLRHSPNARASEKLNELKVHLITIARLDDPAGHSDELHHESALKVIDYLRKALNTVRSQRA